MQEFDFLGYHYNLISATSLSHHRTAQKVECVTSSSSVSRISDSTNVHVIDRSHGFDRKVSAPGEDTDAAISVVSQMTLEGSRTTKQADTSRSGNQGPHGVVAPL